MNVLFTGGRSPATLALIRLFAEMGWRCDVAESLQPNLAGASNSCSKNFTVPAPRQQTAGFIQGLQDIIARRHIDLLVPTCEETFYVAMHKDALDCEVFTPSIDVLQELHSKYRFNLLLQQLRLPAPATEQICDRAQLKARLPEWGKYVLKAEYSRFASAVYINEPLHRVYQKIQPTPRHPWVLQEFLPGPQYCSYSVARDGELTAHSVYPTVYTAGTGATIYFESVDIPAIERTLKTLVKHFNYTGQISCDFIAHRGLYYPIECNPRTTTGTFLFAREDALPEAFVEQPHRLVRPLARRPVAINVAMLGYALPQNPFNAGRIFKDLWRARDPLFQLDDPGPLFKQFGMLFRTARIARKSGTSILAASTLDIEWNGDNCALDTK